MAIDSKDGILLESGTNEFEIVEFTVGDTYYGINVAKVREIIKPVHVTKLPEQPACVDGIIELRGKIIPLVNLGTRLETDGFKDKEKHIIVCEFNQTYIGFLVNTVLRIHRISWKNMESVPDAADTEIATGVIRMDDRLIILLDFEQILTEISPAIAQKLNFKSNAPKETAVMRSSKKILIAEDSKMLRDLISNTLHTAGYANLAIYPNGQDAWDTLESYAQANTVKQSVHLVITDIEMPQMDGHHLLKRIKDHPHLQQLPVVIFSSLINEEMRRKGEGLGAVAQISKPEIGILIDQIDKYVL